MNYIPLCDQCNCVEVNFKNFNEEFRKFCSNKCVNQNNSQNKSFAEKISKSRIKKFNQEYYLDKYGDVLEKNGEWFTKIDGSVVSKNKYRMLKESELEDSPDFFIENYKLFSHKTNKNWVNDYFPNTYKIINERYNGYDFNTKKYLFVNGLVDLPVCPICNTNKVVIKKNSGIAKRCDSYECQVSGSGLEKEILLYIKQFYTGEIIENYKNKIGDEWDIYIPNLELAFEINGIYWHSDKFRDKNYHQNKKLNALQSNVNLIFIWEDDWNNTQKSEIIKSIIRYKLGKSNKIFARNCKIGIPTPEESRTFLDKNHLQGSCVSSYQFGLFYNNELVAIMTFGKSRMILKSNGKLPIELLRFANKKGCHVIGGAQKLLKHFIKIHMPMEIISYASLEISNGNLYEKLGFKNIGITKPGYWWYIKGKRFHRSNFMKHKLIQLGYPKELTAETILKNAGYLKIWNSGNIKYKLTI